MALYPKSEAALKNVDIPPDKKKKIKEFLQGAVWCWCKNKENKWFALRDLVGDSNADWNGTPLQYLYDKHRDTKSPGKASGQAAKDAGWLLKAVLARDGKYARDFDTKVRDTKFGKSVRHYLWR